MSLARSLIFLVSTVNNIGGAVEETFQVLDSAILLVINRLGNIIEKVKDKDELVKQSRALDNFREWENKQKEVYMCNALRTLGGEMDSLSVRIMDRLSVSSRNELGMLVSEAHYLDS